MFIFGWGGDVKELGPGPVLQCPNCKNTTRWKVVQQSKKATVYFVPIAKWSKKFFMVCPTCSCGVEFSSREEAQEALAGALHQDGAIQAAIVQGALDETSTPDIDGLSGPRRVAIELCERATASRSPEERIELLKRAAKADPEWWHPFNKMGVVLVEVGEPLLAVDCYKKALELCDEGAKGVSLIYENLGQAYINAGEYQAAIRAYNQAMAVERQPTALIGLAMAYHESGDIRRGIESLREYLRNPGEGAELYPPAHMKAVLKGWERELA